ncbi:hypothetical protein D3C72_1346680 [compost metagenome]
MAPKPRPCATAARAAGSAAEPSKLTVKTWASMPLRASKKPPASLLASMATISARGRGARA